MHADREAMEGMEGSGARHSRDGKLTGGLPMAKKSILRIRDLATDDLFQFASMPSKTEPYIYNGNGWYSNLSGYAGGPWHHRENVQVYRVDANNNPI